MKLSNLFGDFVNLNEAFDTKFDSIEWETYSGNYQAKAVINNEEFRLYLEGSSFSVDGEPLIFLNIAFARIVDGEATQAMLNTRTNQSKQIGAVVSALTDKVEELSRTMQIDAIVFLVEAGQENRISFYKRILLSKIYGLRPWEYRFSIKWFGGTALVATKELLGTVKKKALEHEILQRRKQVYFHLQ
jgi:hypothetical protein